MYPSEFRKKSNLGFKGFRIITSIEFKAFLRNKNIIYTQVLQPIIYFLFLVVGIGSTIGNVQFYGETISYNSYALVGIVGILLISQMTQGVYRATIDKRWGLLALKFLNGIKPVFYNMGMSTYPLISFIIQTLILYLLALLVGLNLGIIYFLSGILLGCIALLFWTSLGILVTIFVQNYQQRDMILSLSLMPLSFTAPTFFLIESVPVYIKILAYMNPLTYQITAIRSVIFGTPNLIYILVTVIFTLLAVIITSIVLNKAKLKSSEY